MLVITEKSLKCDAGCHGNKSERLSVLLLWMHEVFDGRGRHKEEIPEAKTEK